MPKGGAILGRKPHNRRRGMPTEKQCRRWPKMWQARIAAITEEIRVAEDAKKAAETSEAVWRSAHRRALALAANGGRE